MDHLLDNMTKMPGFLLTPKIFYHNVFLHDGYNGILHDISTQTLECFIATLQSWGPQLDNTTKIPDFLEQLEKFVSSLNGAKGNMAGHVTLAETVPELGPQLDNLRTAADYQVR